MVSFCDFTVFVKMGWKQWCGPKKKWAAACSPRIYCRVEDLHVSLFLRCTFLLIVKDIPRLRSMYWCFPGKPFHFTRIVTLCVHWIIDTSVLVLTLSLDFLPWNSLSFGWDDLQKYPTQKSPLICFITLSHKHSALLRSLFLLCL